MEEPAAQSQSASWQMVPDYTGQGGTSAIMTQPELALQPLLVASGSQPVTAKSVASGSQPVTAKSSHYIRSHVVPAVPVSEAVQPRHIMRRTIATMDLKIQITINGDTHLSMDTTARIESELQAVKVQARTSAGAYVTMLNEMLYQGEPPEKQMRCGVKGYVWTDSVSN